MRITALAGGIGGARFLRGLRAARPDDEITVIGNTGDDIWLFGLRVCPDLDTVMYTLGGGINEEQGWGRTDESFNVKAELAAYGVEPQWFGLGDRDLATHIVRSQMMAAGYSLTEITAALCDRWQPGVTLLPMSDDRVETHVLIGESADGPRRAIHFQEWWVRLHATVPAESFVFVGAETAKPGPAVLQAIQDADVVLLPPSNPVVSIGSILQVAGIRAALAETKAPVVGLSPIIGGAPVRGMADACLTAIGLPTTAEAVGRHYGARSTGGGSTGSGSTGGGLLDGWLVDAADAGVSVPDVEVRAVPLLMTSVEATSAMALAALELAGVL